MRIWVKVKTYRHFTCLCHSIQKSAKKTQKMRILKKKLKVNSGQLTPSRSHDFH